MEKIKKEKNTEVEQKKDFGGPLRVIGTLLLAFIASQLLAVILIEVIFASIGSYSDISDSPAAQLGYVLLSEIVAVGLVYLVLRRRQLGIADIGLGRRPKWSDLKTALLGFGTFYALLIVITVIVTWLIPSFDLDQTQDVGFNNLTTSLDRWLAFFALVLLPPIGEEILMRGYLYTGLRFRLGFVRAMLLTSALFGLAHLEFGKSAPLVWVAALNTFVLSLVLVYVRERTGALYAAILIHMFNNSVAFAIHFL